MSDQFIAIGSTRLKKSNIKAFGITHRRIEGAGLVGVVVAWFSGKKFGEGIRHGILGGSDRVLYVTTYQGENYTFKETEVDIAACLAKLEAL